MKKLIFLLCLVLVALSSCHTSITTSYDEYTPIYIDKINYSGSLVVAQYRGVIISTGINEHFWFTDSIGKYEIGEILNK